MLTRVTIRRFKRFDEQVIPLEGHVVFAGPNNSGKTSAIQALRLWALGLEKWHAARGGASKAKDRVGVPINLEEVVVFPLREMRLLWRDGELATAKKPVFIEVLVEGQTGTIPWRCGLEFQYTDPTRFYVRPMKNPDNPTERLAIPAQAIAVRTAHLPALSGIQTKEYVMKEGYQERVIGEGRAGDILRNLLWRIYQKKDGQWANLRDKIRELFLVDLADPVERLDNEIVIAYWHASGSKAARNELDLASGGSGFHQVLLLLSFFYAFPGTVLLLDEPDAHLEVIRQREIYDLLRDMAEKARAQLIVASHSEVVLEQAEPEDIIAFTSGQGQVRRLLDSQEKAQLKKALTQIRATDYLQAEEKGAVIFLEDYTDHKILQAWAEVIGHRAAPLLKEAFVKYLQGNNPQAAREPFFGLRLAVPEIRGFLLLDHDRSFAVQQGTPLVEGMWGRKEIESYLLVPQAILRACATLATGAEGAGSLFEAGARQSAERLLKNYLLPPFWEAPLDDTPQAVSAEASLGILEPFFKDFCREQGLFNTMSKKNFYQIAKQMKPDEVHPEVVRWLDRMAQVLSPREGTADE